MAINLKFDLLGNPEPPSIVLANRNGNKLGQLYVNAESIDVKDALELSEFSFTLNKYIDDEPTPLWDKVKDFKLVNCPEWDLWFEIKVELDETTETVKTVFCTQLGQAELSQIKVYNIEINTEVDIEREDYKISILCDEDNADASILHRLLEKAPHYSIAYVDESIKRIQRQFSFDDTSIHDAFDEIAEEIGCLFVYNSNSQAGGKPNRSISVYDLQQNCKDCGHRGEFTDKCPKCGSTNIKYGYGEDTTIFVTADELATEGIQLVTDVDSVKNCFKLEGGDDLMTATIRNCNPNGSDYIWYFSDSLKEDMSDELVEKLEGYDEKYKYYYNEHISKLNESLVSKYNALVEKYKDYYNTKSTCLDCNTEGYFYEQCSNCDSKNILTGQKLQTINPTITGYPDLMTAYYNTIDLGLYLKSGLMPNVEMSDTNAEEQLKLLTSSALSPVAVNVENIDNVSLSTANSAVLSMAKVIVKPTYKVEIKSSTLSDSKVWSGQFTVTNYSDETDTATGDIITVSVNNDAETFIKQKIEKALNKENTDDLSISGLFNEEKYNYEEFCDELKKYALNPLKSFYDACDACLSILTEQGTGNEDEKPDLYESLYEPYYKKSLAIAKEIKTREDEIAVIEGIYDETNENNKILITEGLQTNIENLQSQIQEELDFEKHLGKDLWLEFCAYRREDKYSNDNYVSDGLNNAELFNKAREFIEVAEEEIFKSAELQHSISATLNNLLSHPKFKPLLKYFKTGNWIRVQIDDKVYKLRLLEYSFNYGDLKNIPVEFSDVTKVKNGTTDVRDIVSQAASMATSYDSVQRQAKKGNTARSTIDQWLVDGLSAANVQIQSNNNEEVLLTKNGLLARSYDDITGTYSPEQLKITHNIMAYTDDNWETVRQAIGKHEYNLYNKDENKFVNEIGYGMNADFVVAGVVSGSQIIGGDIYSDNYSITDATGSYLNLRDGTFSFGGGSLRYENGKLIISSKAADTNITEINEEWLKTTSVYAENLQVNSAKIQGKLTASQIDVGSLDADEIIGATIHSKTITSSNFIGGYLLIGDENKVGDYAEIANNGTLTCTNVNIYGGNLQIGKILDEEGNHTGDYYTTITNDGYLKSVDGEFENCTITGGSLKMGNSEDGYSAWISVEDGKLYAQGAVIEGDSYFTGTITASDIIGKSTLKLGEYTDNEGNIGYLTWISEDGVLNATGANIDGIINAVKGAIGGWNIDTDRISKDNVVLTTSNDFLYQSLITSAKSPVRIYVSDDDDGMQYITHTDCQTQNYDTIDGRIAILVIEANKAIQSAQLTDYGCSDETYTDDMFGNAEIKIVDNNKIMLYIDNPDPDENIGFGFTVRYLYDATVSPNFCLLEDGSLYASAAKISGTINATDGVFRGTVYADSGEFKGTINATDGNIGALTIADGGLKYVNNNTDVYSLDESGLIMKTSDAKVEVGNVTLQYNGYNTVLETSDSFIIRGQNDTQLSLMTNASYINSDVKIFCKCNDNGWMDDDFEAYLYIDTPCWYNESVVVYCQYANDNDTVTHEEDFTFTFDSGTQQTRTVIFSYSGSIVDGSTRKIRFRTDNGNWSEWITSDNAEFTEVCIVGKIEQKRSNNYIEVKGHLVPWDDSAYDLGTSAYQWGNVFARTGDFGLLYSDSGTVDGSDRNIKQDIEYLPDSYSELFDSLKPVRYKFIKNTSDRYHTGFIAQDVLGAVEDAGLTSKDFAAYCAWDKNDGESTCGLRYSEFIALCVNEIQKLKKRVAELENK